MRQQREDFDMGTMPFTRNSLIVWNELIEMQKLSVGDTELLFPLHVDFDLITKKTKLTFDQQLLSLIELEREGWIAVERKVNGSVEWIVTLDTSKEKALRSMGAFEGLTEKNGELDFTEKSSYQKNECQEKKATISTLFDLKPMQKGKKINVTTQPFIDYWNSKGLRKVTEKQRKTADIYVNRLLRGILLTKFGINREFTYKDFCLSVDRFALVVFDFHYLPQSKDRVRSITFTKFLVYEYELYDQYNNSPFYYFLTNEPIPRLELDLYPALSQHLANRFHRTFRSYLPTQNFNVFEHNDFARAANRIKETLTSITLPPYLSDTMTDEKLAEWMIQAIVESGMTNVATKFLHGDYYFKSVLFPYLGKLQLISEKTNTQTEPFTYLQ